MEIEEEADNLIQEEVLDKDKVLRDLEEWAKKLKMADELLREVYHKMNKVYVDSQ